MSKLGSLKSATQLNDVAALLGFKPSALSFVLFKQAATARYKTFEIPKRTGGTRTIKAPLGALKLLQRRLSDLLQDCAHEINETKQRKDRIAHGFKRGRSIITNARQHRHRRYVFNVDLEDFFPSINFGRVRGYFIKDKSFELDVDVATLLAQIACHEGSLPQGSPCSPVISNLIAHVLDIHLVRLASKVGCTYSRYADDLTFSTNKKIFPPQVAEPSKNDVHRWDPGREMAEIVRHSGFNINTSKTHMQYRTSRQAVTGLVVNKKINVPWEYRHTVRAMVHRLFSTGSFEVYGAVVKSGKHVIEKQPGTINQLHGMLGFVDSIDVYNQRETRQSTRQIKPTTKESMYRRFLIYKDFYAAEAPVILCEGKTDNVYLVHAIRSLAADFPELADVATDGAISLKVRLYKYPRSSTGRILGLHDGGSSALAGFIATYKKDTRTFSAPGQKHPVIILYDNDSGARDVRRAIKQASRSEVKRTERFVHVVGSLYAVATPLGQKGEDSSIEDCFDAAVRATKIGTKTLSLEKNFDNAKHFGKNVFAHQVVRKQADTIDFEGFRGVLENLSLAIKAHGAAGP